MSTDFDHLLKLRRNPWWLESRSTIKCAVSADGLLVAYELEEIRELLDKHYPSDGKVWYFNEARDREIAEIDGNVVMCNPRILWDHTLRT